MKTPILIPLANNSIPFSNALKALLAEEATFRSCVKGVLSKKLFKNEEFKNLLETQIQTRLWGEPGRYQLIDIIVYQAIDSAIKYRHLPEDFANEVIGSESEFVEVSNTVNTHLDNLSETEIDNLVTRFNEAAKDFGIELFSSGPDDNKLLLRIKCFA